MLNSYRMTLRKTYCGMNTIIFACPNPPRWLYILLGSRIAQSWKLIQISISTVTSLYPPPTPYVIQDSYNRQHRKPSPFPVPAAI